MEILSVAWRTDLALLTAAGSEVEDHGGYLVVRTPANPGFWWGNFLLLRRMPLRRDVAGWLRVFEESFPGTAHRAIGVDDPGGTWESLRPLSEAGFSVSLGAVLTATAVPATVRTTVGADVRRLRTDDDWAQRVALSHVMWGEGAAYADFALRKSEAERALAAAGLGEWFGAFEQGQMVSGLGIFRAAPDLARFQSVETHPDHRRRGLASSLIHAASRYALDELGVETLVIVSERSGVARRLYEALGFRVSGAQPQAEIAPR